MTKTPERIDVIERSQPGKRPRFRVKEKRRLVAEASEPGSSISLVVRRNGISSSLLFRWRGLMELGEFESVGADEQVVALSEAFKENAGNQFFLFDHQRFGAGIDSSIRLSTASY